MKRSTKPIGKCKGCELNLRDRCAAFEWPREQWTRSKCRGYNDPELIAACQAQSEGAAPVTSRERRQALFKLKQTEPHYQGVHARK